MSTRKKTLPKPTGKTYRSVAAMLRDLNPATASDTIRFMRNQRAKDRRKAKKLGITLLRYWAEHC